MTTQALPTTLPGMRTLSAQEKVQRQHAAACMLDSTPSCQKIINVGIFFDGTNNNKDRDQTAINNPDSRGHTNVVVLHDAYRDDPENGYYKFYIPGVGTAFPDIGEPGESDAGKAFGMGGDARINWAMIQLVNAIHLAVYKDFLVKSKQAGTDARSWPLHIEGEISNNFARKKWYFSDGSKADPETGLLEVFPLLPKLRAALERKKLPHIQLVNLSVFGFSRGAAQARAFCNLLQSLLDPQTSGGFWSRSNDVPSYRFAGVPLRVQFLGLFDTVASSGLADSSPTHRGFGGWANGTMDIAPCVERSVHFVAAHEIRRAFPASSGSIGGGLPKNCLEVVYPGSHSDVGGGYPSGSQGKALGGRARLLSQVPLTDMYMEAVKSGVPLLSEAELRQTSQGADTLADLKVDPITARQFQAYAKWAAPKKGDAPVPGTAVMLQQHTQRYWRWRKQRGGDAFVRLNSVKTAAPQDRQDLIESEKDFVADQVVIANVQAAAKLPANQGRHRLTPAEKDFLAAIQEPPVPADIDGFFDDLLHDSHATFYMCGPTTQLDQANLVKAVQVRQAQGKKLSALEQRIVSNNGKMPVVTDADTQDLLALMNWGSANVLKFAGQTTRRENDGHIHYRQVYDKS